MPDSKEDYRQLIDKPWGRMFYDMVFRQLNLSDDVPDRKRIVCELARVLKGGGIFSVVKHNLAFPCLKITISNSRRGGMIKCWSWK